MTYGRPPDEEQQISHVKTRDQQEVVCPSGTKRNLPTANPIPSENVQIEGEIKTFSGAGEL